MVRYGMPDVPFFVLGVRYLYDHPVNLFAVLNAVGNKIPAMLGGKIAVGVYSGKPFRCSDCAECRLAVLLRFVD